MPKAVGGLKTCGSCRETKATSEYHRNRAHSDGLHNQCKACIREQNAAWRAGNPDKKAAQRLRNASGTRCAAWRAAGIDPSFTEEDYAALLTKQGGRCAICRLECDVRRRLAVDHDHATGRVRGLLCNRCNTGIGLLRENVEHLTAAIAYLQR